MKDVEVRAGTSTPAPVLSISVPGYADAAIALIFVSVECGDRCGSTWLLLLDRGAGTWRVVAGRTLTMS